MTEFNVFTNYKQDISALFSKVKKSNEFEIDLNMNKSDFTYDKYISMLKYLSMYAKKNKYVIDTKMVLDVNYSQRTTDNIINNYRISINDKELIEKYVNNFGNRNNHVIYKTLIKMYNDQKSHKTDSMTVCKKTKNLDNIIDISDLNMRARLSFESKVSDKEFDMISKLNHNSMSDITYRYKQRMTVFLQNDKNNIIRIDLTNVKTSFSLDSINSTKQTTYELEVEYVPLTDTISENVLDKLLGECNMIIKVLQQSNYIITKTHEKEIINEYKKIMSITEDVYNIDGRQPVSLEIQHATDVLANKYVAIDKADGDRHFMIICFSHVYLISQNLKVRDTGIRIKSSSYDGTIFDCEYIYLPQYKRNAIMIFDCLFANYNDIRKNPKLLERIDYAQKIVNECFIFGKQKGFTMKSFTDKNTTDNYVKYYTQQLDEYMKQFINDIEYEKKYPIIRVKYIIPVIGTSNNEIFKYSKIIWDKYLYGEQKYPYQLDGIIYQPLNQSYITNVRESKFYDYKWKPVEKNTIDFYITFERDPESGKILNVYDNSNENYETNKPYRICYLQTGKHTQTGEVPVLFKEDEKLYLAYLFLDDGEVRDEHGDIIQDGSVVEFSHNNKLDIDEKFRWKPMKTRYDKTEMVNKYKRKYGNNVDIADRIWRSIIVPVRYVDIETLANDEMYDRHINEMRKKVTKEMIMSASKENLYYQKKTALAKPMRYFHNFVKSVSIFTYIGSEYGDRKYTVLDIGCGRGGDLMKFYHAKISSGVCLDVDFGTLHNAVDGAINTYKGLKQKYPAFPPVSFVCADFTIPLDAQNQIPIIQDKSPMNKTLIDTFFPNTGMKQFDRINIQFTFHYFLANKKTWENTCDNINKCLKQGGYIIITTFDAKRMIKEFGKKQNYTTYYVTDGEKKILMDIIKKFPDNQTTGVGMAIDVYNSLISNEGIYNTEYLVDKEFLIDELDKKCNLELVDTAMFDSLFEIHRNYIVNVSKDLENKKTQKTVQDVATYYDQTSEFNRECFKITRLNRLYVFRKRHKNEKK